MLNIYNLKIGDLIVRSKGLISTHYMVYVGMQNGVRMVAENQIGEGVRYKTLSEAIRGQGIVRFEKFGGKDYERTLVIPRINKLLGKSYNLIAFNCEHFSRWIATGKLESKQVEKASNVALTTGTLMLTSRNKTLQTLGVVSLLLGIIGHVSQS